MSAALTAIVLLFLGSMPAAHLPAAGLWIGTMLSGALGIEAMRRGDVSTALRWILAAAVVNLAFLSLLLRGTP